MGKTTSKIFTVILIALFVNSLIFYELSMPEEQQMNEFLGDSSYYNRNKIKDRENILDEESNYRIRQELIEGDYKTQAFFSYKTYTPSLDANGSGYQWTGYDSIPGHDAWDISAKRFGVGGITYGAIPSVNDAYYLGIDYWASGIKSIMYSPVLAYDTTIQDKVHYIFNMHRDLDDDPYNSAFNNMDITFKIILWHFHTDTNTSTEITSVAYLLPKCDTPTDTEYWDWMQTNSSLTSYTVPAGDRFKITYEYAYSDVSATLGHCTLNIMEDGLYSDTGISGPNMNWDIVDGIHSNSYTIYNVDGILGVQLYMREENTPDIDLYNAVNNTVYQTAQDMTIDVTDGSISKYRWDGGTWIVFSDSTLATLPTTHQWHDLEIIASDSTYNNTRTAYYRIGYDASVTNIELQAPYSNGSELVSGSLLNFSVYYVDTVTYEWDQNGTLFPLVDPYDIIAPLFEEDHNLTIRTTDFYTSDIYIYFFTFDSGNPIIQLDNVLNDTSYAPLKTIDVEIYDVTGIKNVKYHWDSDGNSTWIPEFGNIYRTNLPVLDGFHWLYIFAFDNFGHSSSKMFQFYTDSNVFLVELQELTNDSYYQGGETVKITIQKSNGTVRYVWDSGTIKDGSISELTLVLEGAEGIPLTAGSHNLTIITFDSTNILHIFYFNFIVDLEAPIIDDSILSYNNSRFKTSDFFTFTITDNYVSGSELTVFISIDGKANETLTSPYQFHLDFYEDGNHYFYLYAIDLAGNADVKYIFFIIDTTAPIIIVTIIGLVDNTGIDGNYYAPSNAEVQVSIIDDDPSITTLYAWDEVPNIPFTDNFLLYDFNYEGRLRIWIYDSNWNSEWYNLDLIIDVDYPTINLLTYDNITTKINYQTDLSFEIDDYMDGTINLIKYSWDKLSGFWYTSPSIDFIESVLPIYNHNSVAEFYVYVEDIVGNNFTYTFSFIVDIEPPIIDLKIYDVLEGKMVDVSTIEYVQSETPIEYNTSVNDDLYLFEYAWNWDGSEELNFLGPGDSWTLYTPQIDGDYSLFVRLTDETAGSPNRANQTFNFIVDNIVLNFSQSDDFVASINAYENTTNLIYSESVSYILNITDAINKTEIIGLQYTIIKDKKLNLSVEIFKTNNITYEIIITATNVTRGIPTTVEILFYKFEESAQTIRIFVEITKKEGDLTFDSRSTQEVTYGENITITINLDNDKGENVTIISITIDGVIEILEFVELQDGFFQFIYSSRNLGGKGNYSLMIYAESNFFKASTTFDVEVNPLDALITLEVSAFEVIEGSQLVITGKLTMINGTPIALADIIITLYIIDKENGKFVYALDEADYDRIETLSSTTDFDGYFTVVYLITDEINYIDIVANYEGDNFFGVTASELDSSVYSIPPPGLPSWLLYTIIGGSLALALIVSIIVYRLTRRKPFQEFLDNITDEEIENSYTIISPGVVLSIFDQRKGPVPLVMDHSLKIDKYNTRLRMGTENFLLKISDQAYSSLGFEEHDVGRRVGSIVLPSEKMVGWVHGIQLPNEVARGGFENLSLIVLADTEYGSYLLNYQEYLYDEADLLSVALKSKKELTEVNKILTMIRKKSVQIILAAQRMEK